jgi:hypothetical protein
VRNWYGVLLVAGLVAPLLLLEARAGRRAAATAIVAAAVLGSVGVAAGAGVVWPAVAALLFTVAAAGYGRWLGLRLVLDGGDRLGWREVPLRLSLGWATLVCAGLLAGSVGALTSVVIAAVLATGIALAAWPPPASRSGPSRSGPDDPEPAPGPGLPVAWWWGLAVLFLIGLIEAAAPEVRHDALAAHLPIAREFALRHAIADVRENAASYFQLNADVLYAMAMLIVPGTALPKLLHFCAGAAASLGVFDLGARLWGPQAGLTAAAVVAGTPLFWWLGGTAYTDLWVVLFAVGALRAVHLYGRRPVPTRAVAAGLLAGAAVGTKIPGAAVILPLLAVLLLWIVRNARGRERWLSAACLAAGLAVTGAYWYVRAWVLVGNPVHPLLRGAFDSQARPPLAPQQYGMGSSVGDLLALPWRVTWHPDRFVEVGPIGIVYLLLLPVALLAITRGRVPRWLAGVFAAAGLIWFGTAQYLRFFVPVLPVAALLGAGGICALRGRVRTAWAVLTVVGLAAAAASWTDLGGWRDALNVALRRMSRSDYLATYAPGYQVAAYAARALPADARIVGAGEEFGFHYERFFVPISWRGRRYDPPLGQDLRSLPSGAGAAAMLSARGFTHLVVVPDALVVASGTRAAWVTREGFWEEGPRLVYADGRYYLFDVAGPHDPRTPWSSLPVAGVDGAATVPAAVTAQALYGLEAEIRSDVGGARAALSIQWLDASGRPLVAAPRREVAAEAAWRRVAIAATAPDRAAAASVRVGHEGPQRVEVRHMRFYELR